MKIVINGQTVELRGAPGKDAYQLYLDGGGTLAQEQWLASLAQGAPEWAESVEWLEENGDQKKLYVLPDGRIWAWALGAGAAYTNQILLSTDKDGAIYNGLGYKDNTRLNSSYVEASSSDCFVTGFIPVKQGDVIRFSGSIFSGAAGGLNSVGYQADKTTPSKYVWFTPNTWASGNDMEKFAPYDYDAAAKVLHSFTVNAADTAYIRFSLVGSGKDAVITVNEEIKVSQGYRWTDTGLSYTPADNEARVVALESQTAQLRADVAALEKGETSAPPVYWVEAVDALADKIKARQDAGGAEAFQFLWVSDIHGINSGYVNTNGAGTSITSNIGLTAAYALKKYDIPFFAISGDMMSQASHTALSSVYAEYKTLREMLSPVPADRLLAVQGNHDGSWGAPENGVYYLKYIGDRALWNEIYRPQALDRLRVFGGDGSYFYADSPQRVRFIMLNSQTDGDGSVDVAGNAVYNAQKYSVYGTEQLAWLANTALDLPEGWTAVIMAHAPLSWSKDGGLLAGLIDAYNKRTSYSGTADAKDTWWGGGVTDSAYTTITASADFSEAKGEVAAFFHGHVHKDSIDSATYSFPAISITTAGADVRDTDPPERTPGTAAETAMDIVTLDMANRKIHMTRLGVGTDRETSY